MDNVKIKHKKPQLIPEYLDLHLESDKLTLFNR